MIGPSTGFWGKLKQERQTVVSWHPLADHCADVAATCEALLRRTILGRRLARIAGLDALSGVQVDRFCVLAALHDAGKFNIGFQNKALAHPPFKCGHLAEVLGLLDDPKRSQAFLDALNQVELGSWSEAMLDLLVATICHHGRPVAAKQIEARWWEPDRNLDPFKGIEDLVERTRRWFPEAWRDHGNRDKLPANLELQHAWSGLVMLADWLGSSERFFPFSDNPDQDRMAFARSRAESALRHIGLDAEPLRATLGQVSPGYERIKDDFDPRPAQKRMLDLPLMEDGSVTILEAATGSGKTEAAFVHFLRLYHAGLVDGLYFALPTRTAATQIYERVCRAVAHAFPDENRRPPVVLAVPGYISVDDVEGVPLPHFDVRWSDEEFRYRAWAGEHPKRYLAGAIVVGTVDQVLLSALMVSHAHMRATALLRHLLVVDE
ncbi:MAG: CRISPR-associated endonuclease Cas3'', partial [bacterium]|nr:CRISPR-associated endonuclease Cas3'' [bacterium]